MEPLAIPRPSESAARRARPCPWQLGDCDGAGDCPDYYTCHWCERSIDSEVLHELLPVLYRMVRRLRSK